MSQHHPPMSPPSFPPTQNNAELPEASSMAALIPRLRAQVEFYFSQQNLTRDAFLQSVLNSTEHIGAVPIEVIANFPKVRELYAGCLNISPPNIAPPADPRLLQMALGESQVVSVSEDGRWICPIAIPPPQPVMPIHAAAFPQVPFEMGEGRQESPPSPSSQATSNSSAGVPTFPMQMKERTTVIVRDLPPDCSAQEIMEVFTTESGEPKEARLDVGNIWYIIFSTEAQAVEAVSESRGREIRGSQVRARMKSEVPSVPPTPNFPPHRPPPQALPSPQVYGNPYPFLAPPPNFPSYPFPPYGVPVAPMGFVPQMMAPQHPPFPFASLENPHVGPHGVYPPHPAFINNHVPNTLPAGIPGVVPVDMRSQRRRSRQKKAKERNRVHPNAANGDWKRREDRMDGRLIESSGNDERRFRTSSIGSDGSIPRRSGSYRRRKNGRQSSQKMLDVGNAVKVPPPTQILSEENFPSLGANNLSKQNDAGSKQFGGYAKALLKGPDKEGEKTGDAAAQMEEIENGVGRLSFSNATDANATQAVERDIQRNGEETTPTRE